MSENNLLTVIGNKIVAYPNEIGTRHLDRLKQACNDLNMETEKNNELELAMFLSHNNYIVVMNSYGALLFFVPENLSDFQLEFLISNKEILYKMEAQGSIVEILITTEKEQVYNRKNYRNLSTEKQIAGYEGRRIESQLDILYDEVENQKMNIR